MKFPSIIAVALAAIHGQKAASKGSDAGTGKSVAQFQEVVNRLGAIPKTGLTKEDIDKLKRSLVESAMLSDNFVKDTVQGDFAIVANEEKDAEDAVVLAGIETRNILQRRLMNAFTRNFDKSEGEDIRKEINVLLDAFSKVDRLDEDATVRLIKYLDDHPYYLAGIKVAYELDPEFFDKNVLDYVILFFKEANERDPEMAHKIAKLLNIVQEKYDVFPPDYYAKMKSSYTPKRNYRARK